MWHWSQYQLRPAHLVLDPITFRLQTICQHQDFELTKRPSELLQTDYIKCVPYDIHMVLLWLYYAFSMEWYDWFTHILYERFVGTVAIVHVWCCVSTEREWCLWYSGCVAWTSQRLMPWCRHQMKTFSVLLALCAENSSLTGEFPSQRPVTRRFDVFFDLRLNKRLSKQPWGWWFETPSSSLWRQCNAYPF